MVPAVDGPCYRLGRRTNINTFCSRWNSLSSPRFPSRWKAMKATIIYSALFKVLHIFSQTLAHFVLFTRIQVVVLLVLAFTVIRTATQVSTGKPSSAALVFIGGASLLWAPVLDKLNDSLGSWSKSYHYRKPLPVHLCPCIIPWGRQHGIWYSIVVPNHQLKICTVQLGAVQLVVGTICPTLLAHFWRGTTWDLWQLWCLSSIDTMCRKTFQFHLWVVMRVYLSTKITKVAHDEIVSF